MCPASGKQYLPSVEGLYCQVIEFAPRTCAILINFIDKLKSIETETQLRPLNYIFVCYSFRETSGWPIPLISHSQYWSRMVHHNPWSPRNREGWRLTVPLLHQPRNRRVSEQRAPKQVQPWKEILCAQGAWGLIFIV